MMLADRAAAWPGSTLRRVVWVYRGRVFTRGRAALPALPSQRRFACFSRFAARFSASVFAGFCLLSFFRPC